MSSFQFVETGIDFSDIRTGVGEFTAVVSKNPWPGIEKQSKVWKRNAGGTWRSSFSGKQAFLDLPQIQRTGVQRGPAQTTEKTSPQASYLTNAKKVGIRVPWLQQTRASDGAAIGEPIFGAFMKATTAYSKPPDCFRTTNPGGAEVQCDRLLTQIKMNNGKMPIDCYRMAVTADDRELGGTSTGTSSRRAPSGFTAINTAKGKRKEKDGRPVIVNIHADEISRDATWKQATGEFKFDSLQQAQASAECRNFGSYTTLERKGLDQKSKLYAAFSNDQPNNPLPFCGDRKCRTHFVYAKSWLTGQQFSIPVSLAIKQLDRNYIEDIVKNNKSGSVIVRYTDGTDILDISGKSDFPHPKKESEADYRASLLERFPEGEEWRFYDCDWPNPTIEAGAKQSLVPRTSSARVGTKRIGDDLFKAVDRLYSEGE